MTRPVHPDDMPPDPTVPAYAPDPETAKEHVSTALSTAAMLTVTVGLILGAWPAWGAWALCAGGCLLGLMVAVSDSARAPKPPAAPAAKTTPGVSGTRHPGNLHAKGPGADR